ncbi:MAG: hypothetical protein ACRDPR_11105 [Nocardioidaceae bacterium]
MRRAPAAALAALAALVLTGCAGSGDSPREPAEPEPSSESHGTHESSSAAPMESESPGREPADQRITITGDRVEPNGKRIEATAGEPIVLEVVSDRPAELHVHSSPEQEIAVRKGSSRLTLTIDRPGVVDVEEHDTGIVILQLEVH